ncbi:CPBP family intramembrane glutamic endopeptidase [Halobaculum marinum]|uniref:CPBP family intramembrane glutamic endopeptidase n=1 Tax=Halobaculum marinum TaxID=3031996 RepID=A0ABD5WY26_9EURY|nr:CPBP family intramembrane glutamic endopeptidase [Halobaculum sp. DT55]
MTRWTAFVGLSGVVLALLLGLARLSEAQFSSTPEPAARTPDTPSAPEDTGPATTTPYHPAADHDPGLATPERSPVADREAVTAMSAGTLLANVAISQGTFGALLVAAAVWASVPADALGLVPLVTPATLALGVALGVALWLASEAGGRLAERWGVAVNEEMRGALAPRSRVGWAVLLLAVLPTVALFEEFLFRAVLVGAFSTAAAATGVPASPWLLAALSSVAFALGHGAQGRAGVVATGTLGFVLAAAFLLSGSFALVAVAHYLVNALTFVIHEGLGVDW